MEQFLPVVLCHEPEECQKSPSKAIKTGVTIVWIPSYFQAVKPIWTLPASAQEVGKQRADDYGTTMINKGFCTIESLRQLRQRWPCGVQAPLVKMCPVSTCGSVAFDSDVWGSRWVGKHKRCYQPYYEESSWNLFQAGALKWTGVMGITSSQMDIKLQFKKTARLCALIFIVPVALLQQIFKSGSWEQTALPCQSERGIIS